MTALTGIRGSGIKLLTEMLGACEIEVGEAVFGDWLPEDLAALVAVHPDGGVEGGNGSSKSQALVREQLVVCLRNPLETVAFLREREHVSAEDGLTAWLNYYSFLADNVPPANRLIIHYDALFARPRVEIARVLSFLGMVGRSSAAAAARIDIDRRKHWASSDVDDTAAGPKIAGLYRALTLEAAAEELAGAGDLSHPDAEVRLGTRGRSNGRSVAKLRAERERLTRDLAGLRDRYEQRGKELEIFEGLRAVWHAEAERLKHERDALGSTLAETQLAREQDQSTLGQLQSVLETSLAAAAEAEGALRTELESLGGDRDNWVAEASRLDAERNMWASEADRLQGELGHWRGEAEGRLRDRDNWRQIAEVWRTEAARLTETQERRLRRRVARRAFRIARWIWWRLPRAMREGLRPLIFRNATAPAIAPAAVSPPGAVASVEQGAAAAVTSVATVARPDAAPIAQTTRVSVVIPALNGGSDFRRVLESIRRQRGIPSVEIVVMDSGSSDETIAYAEAASANVIPVAPGEFGHGRTRNAGVEASTGDIVVMLVQDAILLGTDTLSTLIRELEEDAGLAAISAQQVPRSDADLYGAFVVMAHQWVMAEGRSADPSSGSLPRRAAAALDDVCAAIRRPAWEELRYSDVAFGEDLDFGLRALERGWRIGISERAAVAHSHTRPAVYHLRRAIADRMFIAPMIGDAPLVGSGQYAAASILGSSRVLLRRAQASIGSPPPDTIRPLNDFLTDMDRQLIESRAEADAVGELGEMDAWLARVGEHPAVTDCVDDLTHDLSGLLGWPPLRRFAAAHSAVNGNDAAAFAAKLVSSVVGRRVGDALRADPESALVPVLLEGV